jgi:hypothetical protein
VKDGYRARAQDLLRSLGEAGFEVVRAGDLAELTEQAELNDEAVDQAYERGYDKGRLDENELQRG